MISVLLAVYFVIAIVRCSYFALVCYRVVTTPKLCPGCHVWHTPNPEWWKWVVGFLLGVVVGGLWPLIILWEIHHVLSSKGKVTL